MEAVVQETRDGGMQVHDLITVELIRDGQVIQTVSADTITATGRDGICQRVGRTTPGTLYGSGYNYFMVGTSQTVPSTSQTNLIQPISGKLFGSRLLGSYSHPVGSNYFTVYRTVGPGTCTGNWYESGLFAYARIAAGGPMLNRGTFSLVSKSAADSARMTHKIQFT
jgi:hypothetical protein